MAFLTVMDTGSRGYERMGSPHSDQGSVESKDSSVSSASSRALGISDESLEGIDLTAKRPTQLSTHDAAPLLSTLDEELELLEDSTKAAGHFARICADANPKASSIIADGLVSIVKGIEGVAQRFVATENSYVKLS